MGDIDDLLSEFDAIDRGDFGRSRSIVSKAAGARAASETSSRPPKPAPTGIGKKSQIDDLLDELDSIGVSSGSRRASQPPAQTSWSNSTQQPSRVSISKVKCTAVTLGPSSGPWGRFSGVGGAVYCDAMRCTRCDFKVIRFSDAEWAPDVDYMFFRNCYPDQARLSPKLAKRRGSSAYACQCQWMSCDQPQRIDFSSELRWVCAGHSQ